MSTDRKIFGSTGRKLLICFLAMSITPVIVITIIDHLQSKKYIEKVLKEHLDSTVDIIHDEISSFLAAKKGRLIDFGSDGFIRDGLMLINASDNGNEKIVERLNYHLLKNKLPLDPDFIAVSVIDLYGTCVASTHDAWLGRDVSHKDYFTQGMRQGIYFTDLSYSENINKTLITMSRILTNKRSGEPIGMLVIPIRGSALSDITRSWHSIKDISAHKFHLMGRTGEVYLVNKDNLMITESRFVENAVLSQVIDSELAKRAYSLDEVLSGVYTDYMGQKVMGAARLIEEMGWLVIAKKNLSEGLKPINTLRNLVTALCCASATIVIILALFITRSLTSPIKKLVSATENVAKGDLDYRILTTSSDEIGYLSNAFNKMTQSLKKSRHDLFEEKQRLDGIVSSVGVGLSLIDRDMKIIWANKTQVERFGNNHEIIGTYCYKTYPGNNSTCRDCSALRTFKNGLIESCTQKWHTGNGEEKWYRIVSAPIKDEEGEIIQVVEVVEDITVQKLAEEKLQALNETLEQRVIERTEELNKYKTLFDNISDLAYICDTKGNIIYVNKAFERLSDHKPEEFFEKSFAPLFDEENLKIAMDVYKRTLNGESPKFELCFKDTEILCEYKNLPMRDRKGNIIGVIGIARDITEQKRATERITSLGHILEDSLNEIYIFNAKTLRFMQVNKGARSNLGYSMEELRSLTPLDLKPAFTPESFTKLLEPLRREEKEKIQFTTVHRRKDGSLYDVEVHLQLTTFESSPAFVATILDVTERKRMEEELRALNESLEQRVAERTSELTTANALLQEENIERKRAERELRLFQNLVNQSNDIICVADPDTGLIKYMSDKASSYLGFTPEELLKMSVMDIDVNIPDIYAWKDIVKQIRNDGYMAIESDSRRKDGSTFPVEINANYVSEEKKDYMIAVVRDVTERKRAAEKVVKSHQIQDVLNSILRISTRPIPLKEQLEHTLDLILSIPWLTLQSKGSIFLVEDDPKALVLKAQRGLAKGLLATCARVPFGKCLCGRAASTRKIVFTDCVDKRHETRYEGMPPHGHYCVPIVSDKGVLGVLNMYVKEGYKENKRDEDFLFSVANTLAGIIERKQAEDSLTLEINEHKRTEEVLRVSEEKYRRLVESLQDNYFFYSHNTNGIFTYLSPSINNILGYSPEEFLTHYTEYLTDNPINKEVVQHTELSIKGIKQPPYELEINHKDGSVRKLQVQEVPVFDKNGKVIAVEGIAKNITEHKRAEEEIHYLKEYLETILGSLDVYIRVVNPKLNVEYENPPMKEKFGDGVGKPCYLIWQSDIPCENCTSERAIQTNRAQRKEETLQDGQIYSVTSVPLKTREGKPAAVEIIYNITRLKRNECEIRSLASRILSVQEDERKRISRELHDEAGQALTAIKLNLKMIENNFTKDVRSTEKTITSTNNIITQIMKELRKISYDLRPSIIDDLGMVPALRTYAVEFAKRTGINVVLKPELVEQRFPQKVEISLYRIFQEALTNISKHSKANNVIIELTQDKTDLVMSVDDDGCGFDTDKLWRGNLGKLDDVGLGLIGIRERVTALGGELNITSEHDKGTKLIITLPLNRWHVYSQQGEG